ncbi:hypothetical protein [Qipengyuania qiaonensis]|uniref:DUF3035 domain-containing protein n=1 Tax=Qipengyuania qiaonensis TaxID=2867240 RepID=A0ABS7JCU1_9SPHN|nr:hypothetical protein [Qipengyuania qiaonensis]MBX7483859.1 hypothetical protein [Qipengyuania qiaonensis]
MNYRFAVCSVAGALMLSACGGDAPPEETEAEAGRGARGEVIGGTISDDMIPLDQLRSQSPPVRVAPRPPAAAASPTEEPPTEPVPDTESGEAVPDSADEPTTDGTDET